MKPVPNKNKGFTLIELLVVIAIIGVLATLLIANFNATRSRARDAQRKSDLRNLSTALRIYFNDFGQYPISAGGAIVGCGPGGDEATVCLWGTQFATINQTYMGYLPDAPQSDDAAMQYNYLYVDDDNYLISVVMENGSDPAIATSVTKCSSLIGTVVEGTYYVCP